MKANEFVSELFTPGKEWKWSFKGSQEAVAVFHVGEIPYQFYAYRPNELKPWWDVEFKNAGRGNDRNSKFGLTGTGNSAEVMSTVADIMRAFLQEYQGKIKKLTFSAKELSRQALYTRMLKRLLPTWSITQDGIEFTLMAPDDTVDTNEAFTSQVPYNVVRGTNDLFTTKATIGNRDIVFNASKYGEKEEIWEVDFYEKTPGNMSFGKTGGGGEMQVFSFVIDSLKELTNIYSPDSVRFSSHKSDQNRSKLYQRMIAKIAPSLGYQLADVDSSGYDDIFTIDRIGKK